MSALCACQITGKARRMRVNHDYDRGGALAYLAAYDVGQATVFGHCAATRDRAAHGLVKHVMTQQPYASAKRVFWIVDNGSSHRGKAAIDQRAPQHQRRRRWHPNRTTTHHSTLPEHVIGQRNSPVVAHCRRVDPSADSAPIASWCRRPRD
ncbi:MAG: hypothetical protein ACRDS0_27955 [Pseudonocardiaceae bacterium]